MFDSQRDRQFLDFGLTFLRLVSIIKYRCYINWWQKILTRSKHLLSTLLSSNKCFFPTSILPIVKLILLAFTQQQTISCVFWSTPWFDLKNIPPISIKYRKVGSAWSRLESSSDWVSDDWVLAGVSTRSSWRRRRSGRRWWRASTATTGGVPSPLSRSTTQPRSQLKC